MAGTKRELVLGVDGGGTKTLAIVADARGRVLGCGRAGNANVYVNPQAATEIEAAVDQALAQAACDRTAIGTAAFSLAGADWPADFEFWQATLERRGLGSSIRVVNDAIGALSADAPEGNVVMVVCGTGAATGSRNQSGATWHSSFWQLTQGGGELGRKALRAVYRAAMAIEPPTELTAPTLRHFAARDVEHLRQKFTGRDHIDRRLSATLVPVLFGVAEAGDAAACGILRDHGAALAEYAAVAARKVDIAAKPFELLLSGGVLRNPLPILRDSLVSQLSNYGASFAVRSCRHEPVRGAVVIALQMLGADLPQETGDNLGATFPPSSFFHTAGPTSSFW